MTDETSEENSRDKLISDLKAFIRLSLNDDKKTIQDWIKEVSSPVASFCHDRTGCNETDCLAYQTGYLLREMASALGHPDARPDGWL